MTVQEARYVAPDDVKHGNRNAYVNHKCRCDACRASNAEYMRDLRERRAARRRLVTY